jgi:Fur family peroxide stress response transcriptional regulator
LTAAASSDNSLQPLEKPLQVEGLGDQTDHFAAACQQAGLAATPQRRVIYRVLADSRDHPNVETIHSRVHAILPRVSLATVYRNLKLFVQAGLVEEVATGQSQARYDANPARHHHLICTRCGGVSDTYSEQFDSLGSAADRVVEGFEVHDFKVNLYGICVACQQATQQSDDRDSKRTGGE